MYPSQMSDEQFEKLLAFQAEQAQAARESELEARRAELSHRTEQAGGRNELTAIIAGVIGFVVLVTVITIAVVRNAEDSRQQNADLGRQCIAAGGVWEDGEDEVGYRCRRA